MTRRNRAVTPARTVALPVQPQPMRRSRVSRRRALSLVTVHVLFAIHISHACVNPRTLAPLEPSESMSFSKDGVISAGLIFFGLSILSTLLLGRWFCGWACHLVALQDFSRWLLAKFRLRPAPLRSRILGLVPLVAFTYMFVAPLVDRALLALSADGSAGGLIGEWHLTTGSFWATFPGWLGAALTFIGCGFFAVYFLGAKGFCTNGCPYGAIFGAADRFAPVRVRVTDACDWNGHCTAVCTSNVRVHEEVRRFGAVVDPGCMKCLDCVSVCPNDALFVGLASDSRARKNRPVQDNQFAPGRKAGSGRWSQALAEVVFVVAAMTLFVSYDLAFQFSGREVAVTVIAAALVMLVRRVTRRPTAVTRQLGLRDEVLLGSWFLLLVAVFRGAGGLVAFLFCLGLASIGAFLLLSAARLLLDRNVSMHGWRLKRNRRWQPAGAVYATALGVLVALSVPVAQAQVLSLRSIQARRFISEFERSGAPNRMAGRAEAAYRSEIASHPDRADAYLGLGMLLTRAQRFADAESIYQSALRNTAERGRVLTNLALLSAVRGDLGTAESYLRDALREDEKLVEPRAALADVLLATGRSSEARSELARLLAIRPDHLPALLSDARAAAVEGDFGAARRRAERVLQLHPGDQDALSLLQALPRPP